MWTHTDWQRWRSDRRRTLHAQGYYDHEIDDIIATEEDERRRLDARIKVRHPIDMTDAGLPHLDET